MQIKMILAIAIQPMGVEGGNLGIHEMLVACWVTNKETPKTHFVN